MIPLGKVEPGCYVVFKLNDEGIMEEVSWEEFRQLEKPVIKNLLGKLVKLSDKPWEDVPTDFAGFRLYVFDHPFEHDTKKAKLVLSYELMEAYPCGICGYPGHEYYIDRSEKEIQIVVICNSCWVDTAPIPIESVTGPLSPWDKMKIARLRKWEEGG